jgi:hypothetical protein
MASRRPAGAGPLSNAVNLSFAICALPIALLCGAGPALTQAAAQAGPSEPSPFQAKVDELARELRNEPRLKDFTEQQRIERVEFVVGNTLFVLLHELGHVHISEFNLPVLGREEDAADTFAALAMINIGTGFSHRVLADAAKGWFLSDRRDQQTGAAPLYYDEHNLSQQRAYQVVCLMVGSDQAKFKDLANEVKMPEARQESCKDDFAKAFSSWYAVLKPHVRGPDQPETRIDVAYGEGKGVLELFARSFSAIGILEGASARLRAEYTYPAPFNMKMESCGNPAAGWDDKTRTLRLCYELAFDFAELYRAYVPATPAPKPVPVRSKRKS